MKSFLKDNYILVLIVILAIGLRFIKLGSIPIGFNDDEAAFGYNAYSIIKTLKDEWGRLLPFPAFESFGDWKLVVYLYLVAISQLVFGVTEFATRFPSALVGVFAVFSTFLLSKELFDKKTGLLAAFLLAISPWHIVASRNAFESDILVFSISTATYFFLKGIEKKNFLIPSIVLFAISFYVYRSAWLFVPIFISALVIFNLGSFKKVSSGAKKYLIIFLLLLLPLLPTVLTFKGQSRFFQESFISGVAKVGIVNEINEKRGTCQSSLPPKICSLLYNKYTSFIATYFNNYFENLSPSTYFTKGIAQGYQSFSNRGLFYSFEFPLFLLGIGGLLAARNPALKVLLPWILIVPIGASFTGIGNPGRLNILMPAPQIVAAFGFFYAASYLKKNQLKNLFYGITTVVIAISFLRLLSDMFIHYPQISARSQRYGYKELFNYLESQRNDYLEVAISRRNDDAKQYIHYLFFNKIDPNIFLYSQFTKKYRGSDGWQVVEQINNVRFYPSAPGLESLPPKSLLSVGEKEVNFPLPPIHVINYPNGDRFFEVYDVDEVKSTIKEQNEKTN